jgi:hypothetical protein
LPKGLFLLWQTVVLECGLPQPSEIKYQLFYIESPPVRGTESYTVDSRL